MGKCKSCHTSSQAVTPFRKRSRRVKSVRKRTRSFQFSNSIRPWCDTQDSDSASKSIPLLNFNNLVKAKNGRIDKIRLSNSLGFVLTDHEDDYINFRNSLKLGSKRVFLTPPDNGAGNRKIDIRKSTCKRNGEVLQRLLFSGILTTQHNSKCILLKSHLFANPTKALRYYPKINKRSEGVIETVSIPTEPRTLDRRFNCLPSWVSRKHYLRSERRYFSNLFRLLELGCAEGAELSYLDPVNLRASYFCIQDCEVYFEFHQPLAREALDSFEEDLYEYGEEAIARDHAPRTEAFERVIQQNGKSVIVRLSKTESLVVYAKTANRLRFEVRFVKPSTNIMKKRSKDTLNGFFDNLDVLRERAAIRINSVLTYLRECAELPPKTIASDWRYKKAWFDSVGWSEVSDELLETLRLQGRFSVKQSTDEEKQLTRKAKRTGLIRYDKERRLYVPLANAIQ